ncbi:hypothetical protein ACOW85_001645 [Vibrio parahaemolyticus]|nr:hypothetical protein [Vibrio parahaemolyticus]
MAKKFFIATCEKKVSKHPVKDGKAFTIPVEAETQADAKEFVKAQVEKLDVTFEGKSETYSDWFKNPSLEKVTEEEFNAVVLEHEAKQPCNEELTDGAELQQVLSGAPYPTLGQDGFYDTKDPQVEESSFIYSSETDNMQAAKVFVLRVGHSQYAYGFRYKFGDFDKHERMNLDRIEEKRDNAVDKAVGRLESFLDYQDEFGAEEQKPFISALMKHDFYHAFLEPSELFIEALSKHPDVINALEQHGDFFDVIEGHFADVWPLDKSPEQAIEHINSMVTISVLYDLEAFTESFKPYLPSVFSEKTKESMKHIEEVIDKPAANDSEIEPRCWKAALPIDDERYAVIAIKDCGDSGWAHASALFKSKQLVFGDDSDFGDEFEIDRKTALGKAVNAITEVMYKFGVDAEIVSEFARDYVQRFEENYIELGVDETLPTDEPKLKTAIRERLKARPQSVELKEKEVEDDFNIVNSFVTENTDIDGLIEAILNLSHCKPLFNEQDAKALVEQFNTSESEPNDFNAYARRLLHIAGEIEDVEDSMIAEIEVKLSGVFSEREFKLQDGEFYSEAASNLMNHVRNMNAPLLPELLNLRALRRLVDDAITIKNQKSGNNEPTSGNDEPQPPQNLPKQGENKPKVTSNEQKVTKQNPLPQPANDELIADSDGDASGSGVPQNIVEQEPANDPEIPEVDLDESNSNMGIWNQSFKTDLNFTKQDPSTGRLSINAQYRQMKATEIFGPRGKGWGVDVKREWLEDGLPIFANGTYTGVNESVHNMEVELWYIHPQTGERCTVTAFGETERFYWSHNYSRMIKNGECRKKSLTDATGKALSMLGICGDVYMGEYDDENIINRSQMTKTTDNALKKLEFDAQATQQALDKAKSYTDKFTTAPSLAEIKRLQKLAETALDAIPTFDKASKAKKDKALSRIAEQAESAINDFKADMKDKDQANG